ncbi:MAG TPA: AI-2E family transporter [Candidatus Udaeobacter sp.]|jgi:predicted PurR-regulated permease PerM|nr:AI-2E family transporter [Candidatus Udaeobacter sp.]
MALPPVKVESRGDVSEDENQAGKVTSRARLRTAELLQKPFDVRSIALTGLFILAVFYTIYFMRSILLPTVLALLLSYLLRPIVRGLAKLKIPLAVSAAVILIGLLVLVGYGISALAAPTVAWLQKAPAGLAELQHKLRPVKNSVAQVTQATSEIEKLATTNAEIRTVEVKRHPITETFFTRTPEFIASAVLSLILLYFLIVYDQAFIAKLVKLLPTLSDKKTAVAIAHDIESQVSRYLFTITVINACLGLAVGTAVGLLGLRNPVMWGVMVALLNFVPYLGALTGIICMTIGATLSFDSLGYALIFPAVYLAFGTLEGSFITPWIMGRSLTLNPVIILLSLTFWGWMWGIVGIILAVPILAAFKIFCAHIKPMEPLAEFLS